jgi:CRISPR-associated protein Csm1
MRRSNTEMDENIYKIAIAAFMHDIGKFAERAKGKTRPSKELKAAFYPDDKFLADNMDLYQPYYNGRYTHNHAVFTAAFIDHIEKLLPEPFNKGNWGLDDPFINLAAGHHKPRTPLQWVIAMADRISSGFDRREFEEYYNREIGIRDYKKTRLLTIFEGIALDGKWQEDSLDSYRFRYPLKELSPLNIFPIDTSKYREIEREQTSTEYTDLFFDFIDSLEKLSHRKNIPLWFEHFDTLFMLYTSHIPAATVGRTVPDVSLYDHSKTTAALASAIYLYHQQNNRMEIEGIKDYEDKKFLLVTGDFYGIQNFIFAQGGSTNKFAAKLLRGRSFAVSLISELAADMLCREIGLTTSSIVLNAAGKFTLLAPNTEQTRAQIKAVEEKINDWLIKIFYGESSLGISIIEASGSDFVLHKFDVLWDRLAVAIESKKYYKIDLEKYGGVIPDYLDQFHNNLNWKLCPFCGKRASSPEVEGDPLLGEEKSACKICRDHIYIGTSLVRSSRIAITTTDARFYGNKVTEPILGKYQLSFDVSGKLHELADSGMLLKYWDISLSKEGKVAKDITAKFINGYIPCYDESDLADDRYLVGKKSEQKKLELIEQIKIDHKNKVPKTFSHIALKALDKDTKKGIEALGVLKADVDHLGLIFACGLKYNSLSRMASLSRQMNHYFSIYLPYILLTRNEFHDIYTVFAGGDDLFLIGPWNRIIKFARFLNSSFREYVCNNNQITLSAGICINKPLQPIPAISEKAEYALKKSKGNGRNSITVFDERVSWEELEKLSEIKNIMQTWMDGEIINNAMLFRLNTISYLAEQEKMLLAAKEGVDKDDWECLKWRAKFKYALARNVGQNLEGQRRNNAIEEVEIVADWLLQYRGAMKIPLWQIIYGLRKGG